MVFSGYEAGYGDCLTGPMGAVERLDYMTGSLYQCVKVGQEKIILNLKIHPLEGSSFDFQKTPHTNFALNQP